MLGEGRTFFQCLATHLRLVHGVGGGPVGINATHLVSSVSLGPQHRLFQKTQLWRKREKASGLWTSQRDAVTGYPTAVVWSGLVSFSRGAKGVGVGGRLLESQTEGRTGLPLFVKN